MMRRSRFGIGFVAVAFAFALVALAPVAVGATEIGVIPGVLQNGTTVVVLQGNGFGPGERVAVTGYLNDGRTAIYPVITADASGAFTAPENVVNGVTRYIAVGQNTTLSASTIVGQPNFPAGSLPGQLQPYFYGPYGGYGGYSYPFFGGYYR